MAQRQANKRDDISALCVETTEGRFGGYKTELLINELIPSVREFFFCYRCNHILREAVSSEDKLVCLACSPCGAGGAALGKKRDRLQQDARKRVGQLQVRCPYKERGCEWEGELGWITVHIGKCPHMPIMCELGCQRRFVRREVSNHYIECKHRIECCKFCRKKYKALEENKHFSNCLRYPVKCTQGCSKDLAREELMAHQISECPQTIVKCPYRKQGCDLKEVKRCEMDVHVRQGREKHETLMRRNVEFLDKEIKNLQEVVETKSTVIDLLFTESNSNKAEFEKKIEALHKADVTIRREIENTNKRSDLVAAFKNRLVENESKVRQLKFRQENNESCIKKIHLDINGWGCAVCLIGQGQGHLIQKLEFNEREIRKIRVILYFLCCVAVLLTAVVGKWSLE